MPQKLLITGATGSIGTKLRRHFACGGFDLRLLCLNPSRDPEVITADLGSYDDAWGRHFDNVKTVIHLAGNPYATASWAEVQRSNIDLTLNVLRAAVNHRVARVIFASSNWIMAGYRFRAARLTTDLEPWPINPYGCAKLFAERSGRQLAEWKDLSFIALRIGNCQHLAGNIPGPHMENGLWGQQMWLSDRDLCHGFECAVITPNLQFAILNLMSDNPGMRWDIDQTRATIGYVARDRHKAVMTPEIEAGEPIARLEYEAIERLGSQALRA